MKMRWDTFFKSRNSRKIKTRRAHTTPLKFIFDSDIKIADDSDGIVTNLGAVFWKFLVNTTKQVHQFWYI